MIMPETKPEPATAGIDSKQTTVGSVFVSNYPPYSTWSESDVPEVARVLQHADPGEPVAGAALRHSQRPGGLRQAPAGPLCGSPRRTDRTGPRGCRRARLPRRGRAHAQHRGFGNFSGTPEIGVPGGGRRDVGRRRAEGRREGPDGTHGRGNRYLTRPPGGATRE